MNRSETVAKVSSLIRLDEAAEEAYGRALRKLPEGQAASRLASIRAEHATHAALMREALATLGASQQPRSADFESFAAAVVERVGRADRPAEVLARTRQAEAAVLIQYADAAEARLPLAVGRLVRRHLARNEEHLDYIDELRERVAG